MAAMDRKGLLAAALWNFARSLNPDTFEPLRLEFYASRLLTGQDIRGADKEYDDLKQTYQIAFLVKEQFFPDDDFFHTFEYYDLERSDLCPRYPLAGGAGSSPWNYPNWNQ